MLMLHVSPLTKS